MLRVTYFVSLRFIVCCLVVCFVGSSVDCHGGGPSRELHGGFPAGDLLVVCPVSCGMFSHSPTFFPKSRSPTPEKSMWLNQKLFSLTENLSLPWSLLWCDAVRGVRVGSWADRMVEGTHEQSRDGRRFCQMPPLSVLKFVTIPSCLLWLFLTFFSTRQARSHLSTPRSLVKVIAMCVKQLWLQV